MNRNMRQDLLAAACAPLEKGEDGCVTQSFRLDESFIGFAGHFTGYPIVPAVTQLLAAQLLVEQEQGCSLQLQTVSHAKFLQQLLPEQTFSVQCREKTDTPLTFNVKIILAEQPASSFRMTFTREGEENG